MKAAAISVSILALAGLSVVAIAQTATPSDHHKIFTPQDIKWSAGPPSLPKGIQVAVLYGDPKKEGPFAMRLKVPAKTSVAPHTHPTHEIVTVISGTFRLGMGEKADKGKAQALPVGSFFGMAPNMPHFAYVDEETVVQITTVGPWDIIYVNPQDDPRKAGESAQRQ